MDYFLIAVGAIAVFGSGLLISTKRYEIGVLVGIVGICLGIWKEVNVHNAAAMADAANKNLIALSEDQSEQLARQSEKISKLVGQLDEQKKQLAAHTYGFSGKTVLRRWNSIFNSVEIIKADCGVEITMHYSKSTNVIEKYRIMKRLDEFLPEGVIKDFVVNSLPVEELRDTFKGSRKLTKPGGGTVFGNSDIVDAGLLRANLDASQKRSFLALFWITPIVLEFKPPPGSEDQECQVGLSDPA